MPIECVRQPRKKRRCSLTWWVIVPFLFGCDGGHALDTYLRERADTRNGRVVLEAQTNPAAAAAASLASTAKISDHEQSASQIGPASASSGNTAADNPEKTSSKDTNKPESTNKDKQKKPSKTQQQGPAKGHGVLLPRQKHSKKRSKAIHQQEPYICSQRPHQRRSEKKVSFASRTKDCSVDLMEFSPGLDSSKDSRVDAPVQQPRSQYKATKPVFKANEGIGSYWTFGQDSEIDRWGFDDLETASAVDINEIPVFRGRKGILKKKVGTLRATNDRVAFSRSGRPESHIPPPTIRDQRENHGYQRVSVYADSREETKRTRKATDPTWCCADEDESTTDYARARARNQAIIHDHRIDDALRQARYNAQRNSESPSSSPSPSRSMKGSNVWFRNGKTKPWSSSEPIVIFRPSNAAADEPDVVVRSEADLNALRRGYARGHNSLSCSLSPGQRWSSLQTHRSRGRAACDKPVYESEVSSDNEGDESDSS